MVYPWQVVCPSVCLSVTLRYGGHIGSNSWKIMPRLISLTFLLPVDPNIMDLLQRKHTQLLTYVVKYVSLC